MRESNKHRNIDEGSICCCHCRLAGLSSHWSGYSIWREEWSKELDRGLFLFLFTGFARFHCWFCLNSREMVMVWQGMTWFVGNQMWLLRRSVVGRVSLQSQRAFVAALWPSPSILWIHIHSLTHESRCMKRSWSVLFQHSLNVALCVHFRSRGCYDLTGNDFQHQM